MDPCSTIPHAGRDASTGTLRGDLFAVLRTCPTSWRADGVRAKCALTDTIADPNISRRAARSSSTAGPSLFHVDPAAGGDRASQTPGAHHTGGQHRPQLMRDYFLLNVLPIPDQVIDEIVDEC